MSRIPAGFSIEVKEGLILVVPSVKSPVWHGNYQAGMLTIYHAEQEGKEAYPDAVALMAVYTSSYEREFEVYSIARGWEIGYHIDYLLEAVAQKHIEMVMNCKAAEVANGAHAYLQ